jgi:hypothetical protein
MAGGSTGQPNRWQFGEREASVSERIEKGWRGDLGEGLTVVRGARGGSNFVGVRPRVLLSEGGDGPAPGRRRGGVEEVWLVEGKLVVAFDLPRG